MITWLVRSIHDFFLIYKMLKKHPKDQICDRSLLRFLSQVVSTHGQVPSHTAWPVKTPSPGSCVNLEILVVAERGPPYNMLISPLVIYYYWQCIEIHGTFHYFDWNNNNFTYFKNTVLDYGAIFFYVNRGSISLNMNN